MRMLAAVMVDGRKRYPVYYETDAWRASIEWAKFHGLNPDRIPAGSEVERDSVNRQIRYTACVMDGSGYRVTTDGELVTVECVEQGEGVLPFPTEVTA
ncbi:MAG: hypothetical protein ABWX92_00670 [Mycetocola sp.]